ncbi:MAG: two-component system alkaline phosphatase synthesis response regulator PhoP [Chlamydiales bacterium]|jgi:two-component system alkaline phosphatase synthesis response regulator PhoP
MNKKILIVDDELHLRSLLKQTLEELEDEGVELVTASDGQDALDKIQNEKPQLVFLDLMLPKINGYEVCETIKHKLKLPGIYIVMLTAKGQQLDKEKGIEVGADLYITKPFDPDSIIEKAREVLGM